MPVLAATRRNPKELFGLLIDAVEDYSVYMLGVDGTVMSWNTGAERNKDYTADEVIGKNFALFFTSDARRAGAPQQALAHARDTGRFRTEGWLVRKDGTHFWAVATLTAMRGPEGELIGFANVTRDLTDRRLQEAALRDAVDEAQKAMEAARVANETKSQFLANMSHELRTPLNAILGFSEMMIKGLGGTLGPKHLEYTQNVHGSGQHLLALINDVLDFAKLDAKAMKLGLGSHNIFDIAQEAAKTVKPLAGKAGVLVALDVPRHISLVCDQRRMLQIFLNLLTNAVKFTEEGGQVTLMAIVQSDGVRLVVHDSGIGMDIGEIPRALQRFGQIESVMARKTQGTGLGLPLVKELVELHGGTLDLASQKGVGTRVTLFFPQTVIRRMTATKEEYARSR